MKDFLSRIFKFNVKSQTTTMHKHHPARPDVLKADGYTLADISIRNPVFAWMLMFGLIFFGWMAFRQMGISQMPDVDFPVVNVSVSLNGASPEVMETNVVDIVEDAVLGVEGVKQITSTSNYGRANVTVEFELSRNIDAALQEVQTKVAQAQRRLPTDLDPPVITKFNPEDQPIMYISVSSGGDLKELMMYTNHVLKNKFTTINGVGEVRLGGYLDRSLRIWVDTKKLNQYELTVDDLITTINREQSELPAGFLETDKRQWNVRSMGEASSVNAIGDFAIKSRGGQPVYDTLIRIRDVARIEDGLEDSTRLSRFNGIRAVGLGILKRRGVNAVDVAYAVRAQVDEVRKTLPTGYDIQVGFDSTKYIEESIKELEFDLVLSALLTGFVVWIFLGSWTSTLNVFLAIPTSIMGTFIVLHSFGFTLNTFTLLGLSLAVGIVVDDAIMVLENIVRHRELGEGMRDGALKGAREITFAALATTLSIVAIFLPVVFMPGIIGKYFFQFGITMSAAVLISLLEALTLTPMRSARFLQIESKNVMIRTVNSVFETLSHWYKLSLAWSLQHRLIVILTAVLIFLLSFLLIIPTPLTFIRPVKSEFVPAQDQSALSIRMQTPVGSSLAYTDSIARKSEEYLLSRGEVIRLFVPISSNSAMMFLTMKPKDERPVDPVVKRKLSQADFAGVIRKDLKAIAPDTRFSVQDNSMRGFSSSRGFPVEITITGGNWEVLANASEVIRKKMNESKMFTDVDSNYNTGQPEIQIYPDRQAALGMGVSVQSISNGVGAMIGGVRAGQFTEDGHRYDIRIQVEPSERRDPSVITSLSVRNNRGELVPLSQLVTLKEKSSLQSITRLNRSRAITIFANPAKGFGQNEVIGHALEIARATLPAGYNAEISGGSKTGSESFASLFIALLLGIVVAYMILASQFNSFLHPVTVLLALPFSFSGALLALWIGGQTLNIFSFIALLLLMGLVKKNSIMLVDFTNQLRARGVELNEAILTASPIRFRPIIMTSFATVAAALPPALSLGPGGETRVPMSIAVIGGMLLSTLLTLYVVPVAYQLFSRFERTDPSSLS